MNKGVEVYMSSTIWTFTHQGLYSCNSCINVKPTNSRYQDWAPVWYLPPRKPASHLRAGWLPWSNSIKERVELCFHWNRHFGYEYALPALSDFASPWTYCLPYSPSSYFTLHCFWPGNSFHSNWSVAIGSCSRNSMFLPFPHHPEADRAGLMELWEDLLKT